MRQPRSPSGGGILLTGSFAVRLRPKLAEAWKKREWSRPAASVKRRRSSHSSAE
jgi:hypothetical protein